MISGHHLKPDFLGNGSQNVVPRQTATFSPGNLWESKVLGPIP